MDDYQLIKWAYVSTANVEFPRRDVKVLMNSAMCFGLQKHAN